MGEEHGKRIPTELEIEIIQHIADEDEGSRARRLALINCALVCKAWTQHVRSHLYYAINMNLSRGSRQFECLREYTYLRPFLREFTWPRTEVEESLHWFEESDADIIKSVAPTVTKLRFRRVDYWSLEPPLREAISTFTNIKELDMTGSIFGDWPTVIRVISSFPFLATLAMPSTDDFGPNSPEISHFPPSGLVHIKLAFGYETETLGWIRKGSPIPNIRTVEAESGVDSNALAKLLRLLGGGLRHLIIHIGSPRYLSASYYRLTENTALKSIEVISTWESAYRDVYRSAISNLIGSIRSPHLQSVSVKLVCRSGEVEHFPWGVVNSLTKVSPNMLQKVEIALQLRVKTNDYWGITSPLSPREYESYFRQVRSALPELDKKLTMSIADISDALSCDEGDIYA